MCPSDKHHSPHARSPSFSQKPSPFFTHHSQHASLPHTSYSTHFPYSLPHFLSLHTLPLSHSFHLCCSSYLRKHDPYTLRIINHNASNDIKPFPFLHISVFTLLHIYRIKPNETSTPHHSINNSITPASCLANLPKHTSDHPPTDFRFPSNDTTSSSTIKTKRYLLTPSFTHPFAPPPLPPLVCSFLFRPHTLFSLQSPGRLHPSLPLHSQKLFPPFISPHSMPCQKHTQCTNPLLLFHEYTFLSSPSNHDFGAA